MKTETEAKLWKLTRKGKNSKNKKYIKRLPF